MPKQYDYDQLESIGDPGMHVQHVLEGSRVKAIIDENYSYKQKGFISRFLALLLYAVVVVACPVIIFITNGVRIRGRRNLQNLKTGAVSICNHVLTLDNMCVAQALFPRKIYFQSQEETFSIKGIRHVVKGLGAYPIPKSMKAKREYIKFTDELLQNKQIVQIFPEGSLWPYYERIRPFKAGAFHFAVKNNVPVIPMCINFRERPKLLKIFGVKAKCATLHIGKPIYPNNCLNFADAVTDLKERSQTTIMRMNKYFKLIDTGKIIEKEEKLREII